MQPIAQSGIFLTIEGIEGVGKSTAMRFIQDYLTKAQISFVMTREPGGTAIAEQIRQVLLTPDANEKMIPETELLLMFASRAQHIATLIQPNLSAGKWVVSDRYVDASYAYQGAGRGFDTAMLTTLERWVAKDLQPNLTILLDAPPAVGLARAQHRGPKDRIEQEKIDFFERVRNGYLARVKADPQRFRIIDATQSLPAVQNDLRQVLEELRTC